MSVLGQWSRAVMWQLKEFPKGLRLRSQVPRRKVSLLIVRLREWLDFV